MLKPEGALLFRVTEQWATTHLPNGFFAIA